MFDLIVRNGRIVDGAGNPWFLADVGVEDGRISKIGDLKSEEAERVIDAQGSTVSPGFIDMHSHSDFAPLINPYMESKVRQGVTTEVIGNCGSSAAPINDFLRKEILEMSPTLREANVKLDWSTMDEYMQRVEQNGVSLNIAPLVGHGNVRGSVLQFERRKPTGKELEDMKRILARAMEDGAFGMRLGLEVCIQVIFGEKRVSFWNRLKRQ